MNLWACRIFIAYVTRDSLFFLGYFHWKKDFQLEPTFMSWARKVWWENLDEQTVSSRTKENIEISRSVFGFYERKMLHLLWDEEECESNETLSYRVEVTDDVYDK